ncbi:MAG: DUF2950 domain-containing protein [Candidatus Hydrogenedentes bacterium]|nr:DUF2950 domain-containing protein [Candidatus Hydrogenedentota bacterium]
MKRHVNICMGLALVIGPCFIAGAQDSAPDQRLFESPKAAVEALVAACEANDTAALTAIFGPKFTAHSERVDDAEETTNRARIVEMANQVRRIEERSDTERVLLLGYELWPLPMPIVAEGEKWRFDTDAGLEELQRRRVGMNELTAIEVCREYVLAQQEYAAEDHDGDGILEFAQKILSTEGNHDGLYWPVDAAAEEPPSPFGPLLADADSTVKSGASNGYMGYHFKILTSQAQHAPGGPLSYMEDQNMTNGFALIAWPTEYEYSGVMTFVVNHLGAVYEKDLGPETPAVATGTTEFDPDPSWILVTE